MLNGRYELGPILGSGGSSHVFRAVDHHDGREVAVKVLRDTLPDPEAARARMLLEADLTSRFVHPGVAQVHAFCDDEAGGPPFLVMDLVEGRTVSATVRQDGPMEPRRVVSILTAIAEALAAAHEVGVIHRDLKPANVILTEGDRPVLIDFGIARSRSDEPITSTGVILGTIDYISPEQAAGRSATHRSDLYALGLIAWFCLTGSSPFTRDSHVTTAMAHLLEPLPPFPDDVPRELRQLIETLTAKLPEHRPASAEALARTCSALLEKLDRRRHAEPVAPSLIAPPRRPHHRGRRRRRAFLVPAAVAATIGLGYVGIEHGIATVPVVEALVDEPTRLPATETPPAVVATTPPGVDPAVPARAEGTATDVEQGPTEAESSPTATAGEPRVDPVSVVVDVVDAPDVPAAVEPVVDAVDRTARGRGRGLDDAPGQAKKDTLVP